MASIVLVKPKKKIEERYLAIRSDLFPDTPVGKLWHRKGSSGFTTIPRLLPIMMAMMDSMTKGKSVSSTYLELWCRAHDEALVSLSDAADLAGHSGFTGERAVRTWRERLKQLEQLGFIKLAGGSSGAMTYALILNPYLVIKQYRIDRHPAITEERWNSFIVRVRQVGVKDLDVAPETPVAP
jgi:hypothetical protein